MTKLQCVGRNVELGIDCGAICGRSYAGAALEHASEVTLITEASCERNDSQRRA